MNSDDIYVKRRKMVRTEWRQGNKAPEVFEVLLSVKSGHFIRFTDQVLRDRQNDIIEVFGSLEGSKEWFKELNAEQDLFYAQNAKINPNNDSLPRSVDD